MSLYGHARATTPFLDKRGEQALVFEQAIAPGMWTAPTHASMFTGLPVSTTGVHAKWIWLDGHHETLAERLSAAGHATFAFSANPYVSAASNLLQGFETVEHSWEGQYAAASAAATHAKLIDEDRSVEISPGWERDGAASEGWPAHLTLYKDAGPVAVEALGAWLTEVDQPFFAFLNLLEAHHPRIPSRRSRDAVAEPAMVQAGLTTDGSLFRSMSTMEGRGEPFQEAELEAVRSVYDAALRDLDEATESLFVMLEAQGRLQSTAVVVLSDHGENLGEHGLMDHRWSVHHSLVHVPLFVYLPQRVAPGRVAEPVSTSHLFGTVLELAGVPDPDAPSLLTAGARGRAFVELVEPTPRLPMIRRAYPNLDPKRWAKRYKAIVQGERKLIRDSAGELTLFDLAADPHETADRAVADREASATLLGDLRSWYEGIGRYRPALRTKADRPRNALDASDELKRQLEVLGYAEGE
jgi:arylsulfatase A-like enzyme